METSREDPNYDTNVRATEGDYSFEGSTWTDDKMVHCQVRAHKKKQPGWWLGYGIAMTKERAIQLAIQHAKRKEPVSPV